MSENTKDDLTPQTPREVRLMRDDPPPAGAECDGSETCECVDCMARQRLDAESPPSSSSADEATP